MVFHSRKRDLEGCLKSLRDCARTELLVVDVSPAGAAQPLANAYSARYVPAPQNLGYSWALNLGAQVASAGVIVFSNSDIVYLGDSVRQMAELAARGGIWAPVQLHPEDGSLSRNTIQVGGSRGTSYARWLGVGRMPAERRELLRGLSVRGGRPPGGEPRMVPRGFGLSGASLCMARSVFDRLGGWDENFFLYDEDTDLSMRAHSQGISLGVAPAARILHAGGYKCVTDVPTLESASCVSERYLWAKHAIGPEFEIRNLQLAGIVGRRFARRLQR